MQMSACGIVEAIDGSKPPSAMVLPGSDDLRLRSIASHGAIVERRALAVNPRGRAAPASTAQIGRGWGGGGGDRCVFSDESASRPAGVLVPHWRCLRCR